MQGADQSLSGSATTVGSAGRPGWGTAHAAAIAPRVSVAA